MGMKDGVWGSKECQKGSKLVIYGGIFLPKGLGIQDNDECCNQPKNVLVVLPICWKRFKTTSGARM